MSLMTGEDIMNNKLKCVCVCLVVVSFFGIVSASSVSVWQGQYYTGTTFNTGSYSFNFSVYDALMGGSVCFTNTTSLTTGNWGEWRSEQSPWSGCNNASKDYFLNINIAGADQTPRRRLTVSDFLRRDVSELYTGNLNVSDNVSASYYFGDGSLLVGVGGGGDINSVQGGNIYIYNGSDSGNVVLVFNETRLNLTIDDRVGGGDNSSWNESYANSLYADISVTGDNSSFNQSLTDILYYGISNPFGFWNSTWAGFNKTYADTLYAPINYGDGWNKSYADSLYADISVTGDNSSWNESYADGLYADIGVTGDNSSWNESYADGLYLQSESDPLWSANFSLYNTSWSLDTDTTYLASTGLDLNGSNYFSVLLGYRMPQSCNDGEIAEYNTSSGGWDCAVDNTAASGMASWVLASSDSGGSESITDGETVTYADDNKYLNATRVTNTITYSINEAQLNMTIDDRAVGDNASWNKSYADGLYAPMNYGDGWNESYADSLYADIGVVDTDTQKTTNGFYLFNDSTTISFNDTQLNLTIDDRVSGGDNSSWNESYADTLYAPVNYGDGWNDSYADTLYYGISNPYGFYNSTNFVISDYFTKVEVLGFSYYNSTDFVIGDYYLKSNPFGFWNDSYASFNKSYADSLYASISVTGDNSSWNESYADGKYLQSYIETDPLWSGNYTNVAFTNVEETFEGNVTVEGVKLEADSTNHLIYDNSSCVIIKGDTSTMYIC
jgi:hypothetical protein